MPLTDRRAPSTPVLAAAYAGAFFMVLSVAALPVRADTDRAAMEIRLEKAAAGLTAADAGALGPGEIRLLFAIVDDRAASPALRARALAALGVVRTPATHD